jgi:hypothetical protein
MIPLKEWEHFIDVTDFIEMAHRNRDDFLEPHRQRVEHLQEIVSNPETDPKVHRKSEKEISSTVVDLLKIEPSHLEEVWISRIIQSWMRDHDKIDELKDAFISQKGRKNRTTPEQRRLKARYALFCFDVKHRMEVYGYNLTAAINAYITYCQGCPGADPEKSWFAEHDFSYLWKKYYELNKEPAEKMPLLFPYYGRDVVEDLGAHVLTQDGLHRAGLYILASGNNQLKYDWHQWILRAGYIQFAHSDKS